jgi:hypothetical protein
MDVNLQRLKKDLLIKVNNDQFYKDIIYYDFSIIHYGEKLAKIFYKILNLKHFAESEKQHALIIKNILKENLKPPGKIFLSESKKFIKRRNESEIKYLINIAEYFTCLRYKALKSYVKDLEILKKIDSILIDEQDHIDIDKLITNSKFSNYFLGYDNVYVYEKYKNELNMSYLDFKGLMYNSNFCKKIRGEIND